MQGEARRKHRTGYWESVDMLGVVISPLVEKDSSSAIVSFYRDRGQCVIGPGIEIRPSLCTMYSRLCMSHLSHTAGSLICRTNLKNTFSLEQVGSPNGRHDETVQQLAPPRRLSFFLEPWHAALHARLDFTWSITACLTSQAVLRLQLPKRIR